MVSTLWSERGQNMWERESKCVIKRYASGHGQFFMELQQYVWLLFQRSLLQGSFFGRGNSASGLSVFPYLKAPPGERHIEYIHMRTALSTRTLGDFFLLSCWYTILLFRCHLFPVLWIFLWEDVYPSIHMFNAVFFIRANYRLDKDVLLMELCFCFHLVQ